MGGSDGGAPSRIDLSRLTSAAEDRLKELAQSGKRLLFACEQKDRKSLDSHLKRSKVFDPKKYAIHDPSTENAAVSDVDKVSVVVVFTASARACPFLDRLIEASFEKRKPGIHAKAQTDSLIPSRASAYRWPSLEWDKVEQIFAE